MIKFQQELLTIPSDLKLIKMDYDPYYRYKMPELKINYGKNTTNFVNLDEIAKALNTPPQPILEFFSVKLYTSYSKEIFKKRTQYRLKGLIYQSKLQRMLDKFILDYVLCKKCYYPELRYFNSGQNRLKSSCNSCGHLQVFDNINENKILKSLNDNPLKKTQEEINEQQEEKIYGNTILKDQDFISSQSEQSYSQQSEEQAGAGAT